MIMMVVLVAMIHSYIMCEWILNLPLISTQILRLFRLITYMLIHYVLKPITVKQKIVASAQYKRLIIRMCLTLLL